MLNLVVHHLIDYLMLKRNDVNHEVNEFYLMLELIHQVLQMLVLELQTRKKKTNKQIQINKYLINLFKNKDDDHHDTLGYWLEFKNKT